MTKLVWRDTATGKIYNISKVEDVATEVIKELSFEEACALVDEQCSKAELMKFLTNRKNIYDIAKLLLPKRFEQTEINISKKWIEDETDIEFYSYAPKAIVVAEAVTLRDSIIGVAEVVIREVRVGGIVLNKVVDVADMCSTQQIVHNPKSSLAVAFKLCSIV
jgi:hypothetical protein